MTDAWFHKRKPHEGVGYGIKNAKGLIASIVFIVLMTAVVIAFVYAPSVLHTPEIPTLLTGIGVTIVLIFAFVVFVIARSDAR